MTVTVEEAIDRIVAGRVTPTVRAESAAQADAWAGRIVEGGVTVFEFTATTPDWESVLAAWSGVPGVMVGLGTVTGADTAERAIAAGADFLVSPFSVRDARSVADAAGTLLIEGGFTPNEIRAAATRGVAKLFPANVGGLGYLRSLRSVLPGARITATGGIGMSEAAAWLDAGASAVSIGSDLFAQRDLTAATRALMDAVVPAGGTR